MIRKLAMILFLAFAIGACDNITPDNTDWCYSYNFDQQDYGFSISSGSFVSGVGLVSSGGLLQFSYDYGAFVEPSYVFITVDRPTGITGDIAATANGLVYGVSASFSATLPSILDTETLSFEPATAGLAGTQINVTVDVGSQEIAIKTIDIRGYGSSVLPNECAPVQPTNTPAPTSTINGTPAPPTPSYTPTPTPTETLTPTPTDTPTPIPTGATGTPTPTVLFDWTVPSWLVINDYIPANYSLVPYPYTSGFDCLDPVSGFSAPYSSLFGCGEYRGSASVLESIAKFGVTFNSSVMITSATITSRKNGTGATSHYLKILDGVTELTQLNYSTAASNESVTNPVTLNHVTNNIEFEQHTSQTYSGAYISRITIYGYPMSGTPTPSPSPSATRTALPSVTPMQPTRTPITLQTQQPITATAANTQTPSNTLTPLPTGTYLPTFTPYSTAIVEAGTPTPSPDALIENEAEWEILDMFGDFFTYIGNIFGSLFDFFNNIFSWLSATIENLFRFISDLINFILGILGAIIRFALELFEIIGLFIQLIVGLIRLLISWLILLIDRLATIIGIFFNVAPSPLPGMPLCVTDPLSYDICAIYYIGDWTLFAPGTEGQFIVPLITSMMSILILLRFTRIKLRIVKAGTDVSC